MNYEIDGSFEGLLCAIFTCFERQDKEVNLVLEGVVMLTLFDRTRKIETDYQQAKRVWLKLQSMIGKQSALNFYKCCLSEDEKAFNAAFYLLIHVFNGRSESISNYGEPNALYFAQTLKKVNRERHRMTAFVRFQKSKDGLFVSRIAPDFNVLPLVGSFFKNRYADQPWIIFDTKRNFGIWYDLNSIVPIEIPGNPILEDGMLIQMPELDDRELHYQELWQKYYQSTTIKERVNPDLFVRHVPRRYWSELTELNYML